MRKKIVVMLCICFLTGLVSSCGSEENNLTVDNNTDVFEESSEIVESDYTEAESEEEVDIEDAESESKETHPGTAEDIKNITWEQVDYNVVDLHFIFGDTVFDGEIVAYSVQDIVFEDITGNGIDEALIYCDFANNICDWQLVYFFQFEQGSVIDISPSSKDIPELENADWGLWNMWIANETMGDYSSPVYKLESYYKEQGILYVEETLYIGFRDGKWELVQEF